MSKHIWMVWLAAGGVWVLYLGWLSGYQSGYEEGHARGWSIARQGIQRQSPVQLYAQSFAPPPKAAEQVD